MHNTATRIWRALLAGTAAILLLSACDNAEQPTASWETAAQGLYTASLSNDGTYAVVGSIFHGGSLWDMRSKERLYNWNHKEGDYTGIVAAAFSPEGNYAATASHRTIVLWEVATGKPVWFWTATGDVLSMALTPNGDYALLGLEDHTAVLFDIKNGGVLRTYRHDGKVRSVALTDDAQYALTGSDDRTAKLWNLETAEAIHTWEHDNQLVTTALSPGGKYAFTAAQADKALIWDVASGNDLMQMPIAKSSYIAGAAYTAARFSDDESRLLTGTNSQLVQLWNISNGQELKRWKVTKKDKWKPSAATVLAVSFGSNSSQYVAVGSNGLSHQLR